MVEGAQPLLLVEDGLSPSLTQCRIWAQLSLAPCQAVTEQQWGKPREMQGLLLQLLSLTTLERGQMLR